MTLWSVKKSLSTSDNRLLKIAQKLKQMRLDKGYTSYETFAWENEINRVQYWRIEKGSNITLTSLMKVLDIHNVSLKDFFEDIE
jgi:hypothetical protein